MYSPKDVRNKFLPLTISSWILGIGVIEYPLGRPRVFLSLFYTTFTFILVAISSFIYKQRYSEDLNESGNSYNIAYLNIFVCANILFYLFVIIMERIYRIVGFCIYFIRTIDILYKTYTI